MDDEAPRSLDEYAKLLEGQVTELALENGWQVFFNSTGGPIFLTYPTSE